MSAAPTKSKSVPPVPLERLEQIVSEACKLTFADVEVYEHPKTRQWNQEIIDYILQTVVAEATPGGAKHPPFKFFVNSTIVQHQTPAGRPARLPGTTHPSGAPAPAISTIAGLPGTNTQPTAPAGDIQKNEASGTQTEPTAVADATNIKNEPTSSTAAAAADSESTATTNTDPTAAAGDVSSRMSNLTITADHRASTWTTNTLVNTDTVPPQNLSENTPRINVTEAPSANGGPSSSRPGAATQPRPSVVGRRGIHSATRGYWDESTDGMWSYKYEGDRKGLDVIVMFLWIGL